MDGGDPLAEMRPVCAGARLLAEAGVQFVDLPGLTFPSGEQVLVRDGLLSLGAHSGYPTRLFLSETVPGRGSNWTVHVVLGRTWHTWSWNYVPAALRPTEILAAHLRALL